MTQWEGILILNFCTGKQCLSALWRQHSKWILHLSFLCNTHRILRSRFCQKYCAYRLQIPPTHHRWTFKAPCCISWLINYNKKLVTWNHCIFLMFKDKVFMIILTYVKAEVLTWRVLLSDTLMSCVWFIIVSKNHGCATESRS